VARFSPLFFRAEISGSPLIITINDQIGSVHKEWLASDQAVGAWNYKTEQKVTHDPRFNPPKVWSRITTTVWFTDLNTAMGFKLTFG
jgi:hypothetical protein